MANIKVLNLESSSSLSELSHEDVDCITGGAIQQFVAAIRSGAGRDFARRVYISNYISNRRGGASRRTALAISLSNPE